jgi:hypothetical protein
MSPRPDIEWVKREVLNDMLREFRGHIRNHLFGDIWWEPWDICNVDIKFEGLAGTVGGFDVGIGRWEPHEYVYQVDEGGVVGKKIIR